MTKICEKCLLFEDGMCWLNDFVPLPCVIAITGKERCSKFLTDESMFGSYLESQQTQKKIRVGGGV